MHKINECINHKITQIYITENKTAVGDHIPFFSDAEGLCSWQTVLAHAAL